eukprot:symbB.v1.2.026313.t1/scaffold2619.1/size74732/3
MGKQSGRAGLLVLIFLAIAWTTKFRLAPSFLSAPIERVERREESTLAALSGLPVMLWAQTAQADNFDPSSMPTRYSAFDPANSKDNDAIVTFFFCSAFFGLFAAQVAGAYNKGDDK